MKGVRLTMKEQSVYEVIKSLVDHGGSKDRAALKLGCSRRSIDRYIAGYRAKGKAYFVHGNRGRPPAHALDKGVAAKVVKLYVEHYHDTNFAHFTQLLQERESLYLSESSIRRILSEAELLSPRAFRRTRRKFKADLEAKAAVAKGRKEIALLRSRILASAEAHPRRSRCSYFGEMIQMDASLHLWFGTENAALHLAVDDASGTIVGAWFDRQETLFGYYATFHQILTVYGIPFLFYTDRRTVFEYRKSGSSDSAEDSFTQFSYACKQLGVEIKTTSVPQAKGRIERLFSTMQSRLPAELRLEGVTSLEQANAFLPGFIARFNARFALDLHSIPSVFETQPSPDFIDRTLAILSPRTVDPGHSIRFENQYFRTASIKGLPVYLQKGTKGLVIRTFSGSLFFSTDEDVYVLEAIPTHERHSRNFDPTPPPELPHIRYIPPLSHPWKQASFRAFTQRQAARSSS